MTLQNLIITFLKWFFIGQGVIWSFLTFYVTLAKISIREQGIGFGWVISIIFALIMTFVSKSTSNKIDDDERVDFFD